MAKITPQEALEVLIAEGRKFSKSEMSRGKAVGLALYSIMEPYEIREAAKAGLEGWNDHLSVALLIARESGTRGDVDTQGRMEICGRNVTITLPTWWEGARLPNPMDEVV